MDKVRKYGKMAHFFKVNMLKEKNKVWVNFFLLMDLFMKADFIIIVYKVKVYINGRMEKSTKENGNKT
jgi:hypothetical protein